MGVVPVLDITRLVILSTATYAWWANIHGIAFPKYFWDMIGGTLGDAGWIPPPQAAFFISIIVDAPILQSLNLVMGILITAFEWPLPFIKDTALYRSYVFRFVFYAFNSFTNFLVYQSVDAGFFFFGSMCMYLWAMNRGETFGSAKKANASAA